MIRGHELVWVPNEKWLPPPPITSSLPLMWWIVWLWKSGGHGRSACSKEIISFTYYWSWNYEKLIMQPSNSAVPCTFSTWLYPQTASTYKPHPWPKFINTVLWTQSCYQTSNSMFETATHNYTPRWEISESKAQDKIWKSSNFLPHSNDLYTK